MTGRAAAAAGAGAGAGGARSSARMRTAGWRQGRRSPLSRALPRLLGAALLALLAACGADERAGAAQGKAKPKYALHALPADAPLPGPEAGAPHPRAADILLLPAAPGAPTRGWVTARAAGPGGAALPAIPFVLDPRIAPASAPRPEGAPAAGPAAASTPGPAGGANLPGHAPGGAGARETPLPILFLGGDREGWSAAAMTPLWRHQAREAAARAGLRGPLLTLGRPYAGDPSRWRTRQELASIARALAILSRAYGFGRVDALAHSSGAHLAVGLAQETGRIRNLSAAAPPLDLMAWHEGALFGPSAAVRAQYDPLSRVAGFSADAMALVADPQDSAVPPRAWRGWLAEALRLGKPARLLFAQGAGPDRHGLLLPAAEALAALRAGR